MAFDKNNAMRNAERFLSQGKFRSAIDEYKQIVQQDSRDYGTLNMLGDLYAKDGDTNEAIKCFTEVAEYYGKQGFAAKAIAVYKKVKRISPETPQVSERLAELYRERGSVTEAKSHYVTLAEHYQSIGRKIEALAIWKQIALLDPLNTEVYQNLGESFLSEGQNEEAIEAFVALGERHQKLGNTSDSTAAFDRALAIDRFSEVALSGLIRSSLDSGRSMEVVARLEGLMAEQQQNHAIARLLIECHLKTANAKEAEDVLIKLAEVEPSNYPLFVELARLYLDEQDLDSAARVLTMSSEHLLAGGQMEAFRKLIEELLSKNADHIEGLRLMASLCTWLRDDAAYLVTLRRLAASSRNADSVNDERFALSQLVMVVPHEVEYRERLSEINAAHGFEDDEPAENLFDQQFFNRQATPETSGEFAIVESFEEFESSNGLAAIDPTLEAAPVKTVNITSDPPAAITHEATDEAPENDEDRLKREIASIRFYVDNGYVDLAGKAAEELRGEFGSRPEVVELLLFIEESIAGHPTAEPQAAQPVVPAQVSNNSGAFELEDFRNELGFEDMLAESDSDYETLYNTATAYQEMGLLEEAIKAYQEAANLVSQADGTRRFFQCSNLIAHCFMQLGKPHVATTWYERALESPTLTPEEKQGLWYEYANACESNGDHKKAAHYFELVYAENIDYRDVGERLRNMAVAA